MTLPVYRSDDGGATYVLVTTCTISGTLMCTFLTNHFSLFAVGAPVVVVPGSGTSSGPGGPSMGGGGSYVDFVFNRFNGNSILPNQNDYLNTLIQLTSKGKKTPVRYIRKVLFFPKTLYKLNTSKNIFLTKSAQGSKIV